MHDNAQHRRRLRAVSREPLSRRGDSGLTWIVLEMGQDH